MQHHVVSSEESCSSPGDSPGRMEMAESLDRLLGNYNTSPNNSTTTSATSNQNFPNSRMELTIPNSQPSPPLDVPDSSMELIRINVGGQVFVTTRGTLDHVPGTRLSNLCESDPNYHKESGEWFFDRNPIMFGYILDFYRCDELHFPHHFCGPSIQKELMYWNVDEADISPCCWNRYREFEEEKKIFERIDEAFESKTLSEYANMAPDLGHATQWQIWRRRINIFLEEPMSSKPAKIWTCIFLSVVLLSIAVLCIETDPALRVPIHPNISLSMVTPYTDPTVTTGAPNVTLASTTSTCTKHFNPKIEAVMCETPLPILENIDIFCTCFFTVEFFVRLLVTPVKIKFFKTPMNIIDVLCVLPMWINLSMRLNEIRFNEDLLPVFFIIMALRVLRICRVLRLARHYTGVKILLLALRASVKELSMLLIFVFIVILIFAVVIYYAEFFVADTFRTIPEGYWWAIITITTVGYGDFYPKGIWGYIVGGLCALTGILATGLPVPIIANNFNIYYTHAKLMDAVAKRKASHTSSRGNAALMCGSKNENSVKHNAHIVSEASV